MAGWQADNVCGVTVTLEATSPEGAVEKREEVSCTLPTGHEGDDHYDARVDVMWPDDVDLVVV